MRRRSAAMSALQSAIGGKAAQSITGCDPSRDVRSSRFLQGKSVLNALCWSRWARCPMKVRVARIVPLPSPCGLRTKWR